VRHLRGDDWVFVSTDASIVGLLSGQGATNLLTLALVVSTIAYTYFTWNLAKINKNALTESVRQDFERRKPKIVVIVNIKHRVIVDLTIKNIGLGAAENMKMAVNRKFVPFSDADRVSLNEMGPFKESIPAFPSGQEIHIWLSQGFNLNNIVDGENITPAKFTVTIEYSFEGRSFSEETPLNIEAFIDTIADVDEQIEVLKEISTSAKKIAAVIEKRK